MTSTDQTGGADARFQTLLKVITITGILWLAFVAWILATRSPFPFHGYEIYDVYYNMILEGQLDLPPRTLRFEGHYAPDGTGYLYHGVAPLLTRFAIGWAWPFETVALSGPSIWFWAVLGTIGYQSALVGMARSAGLQDRRRNILLILCSGLWFAGPGLLLVSNQTFYHEPMAAAFGATGLFVLVWVRIVQSRITLARAAPVLACLAIIAFHARPNLAVALYTAVALAVCYGLWKYRTQFLLPALLAGALLGSGVSGFMALNEARFGSATQVDGDFEESARIYGFVFWGEEDADSDRAQAFKDHGRFNLKRVLPNLGLYLADVPVNWPGLFPVSEAIYKTYRAVTEPNLGLIRIEHPRIGMLITWSLWIYLSLIGIGTLRHNPAMAALAGAMALSFMLTLAYGTVTLRYRFDLWPLLGVLALLGAVRVLNPPPPKRYNQVIVVLSSLSLIGSLMASYEYSNNFRDIETGWTQPWTEKYCTELARNAGFEGDDLTRICRRPPMGGT